MNLKEKILQELDKLVRNNSKKKENSIDLSFLESLDTENLKREEGEKKMKSFKEQTKDLEKVPFKGNQNFLYYLGNFYKKAYLIEIKDYNTGNIRRALIRGVGKKQASENAKIFFNLKYEPDIVKAIEVSSESFIDSFLANPTFFTVKKIKKEILGLFLIEYSSLMKDGLSKKDAIDILLKIIKDPDLRDFMYEFRDSSYSMSALMKKTKKFEPQILKLIESSEVSGGSSQFYEGISKLGKDYIEEDEFKKRFKKDMAYPVFMLGSLFVIVLGALYKVIPNLVDTFSSLLGEDKLPPLLNSLNYISININYYILIFIGSIIGIKIISGILLSNDILNMKWNLFKLDFPLVGNLIRKKEENQIMTVFTQTITSQLTPGQKLKMLVKTTKNPLYEKIFLYLVHLYPNNQNIVKIFEIVQKQFKDKLFEDIFIIMLKLSQESSTTEKRLEKYESFLTRNKNSLKETMETVKGVSTTLIIASAGMIAGGMMYIVASVSLGAMGS